MSDFEAGVSGQEQGEVAASPAPPSEGYTRNERLAAIRTRHQGKPTNDGPLLWDWQDIDFLLAEEARFRDAVRTCADEGECPACWEEHYEGVAIGADRRNRSDLLSEVARLEGALQKINEVRNSIVGLQTVNWSAHIYPLVAALNEAGIEGMGYDEARPHYSTMLERAVHAEAEGRGMRDEVLRAVERLNLIRAHNATCQGSLAGPSDCFPVGAISAWIREHEAALNPAPPDDVPGCRECGRVDCGGDCPTATWKRDNAEVIASGTGSDASAARLAEGPPLATSERDAQSQAVGSEDQEHAQ